MSEKSDWEQGYDQAQRRFYEERKILTARIAELEAERRWIPVSERLPEVNEDVFTVVYDTNDGSTSVSALKHHGDGVWFIWDKGYYVVTHWMPMPKLPEPEEVK